MIEFSNDKCSIDKSLVRYTNPSLFTTTDGDASVAVLGAAVDLSIGDPKIFYQLQDEYDFSDNNGGSLLQALKSRLNRADSELSETNPIVALKITWEGIQPPGSQPGEELQDEYDLSDNNGGSLLQALKSRLNKTDLELSEMNPIVALKITWEGIQPPGSQPGQETNKGQAVVFTDGKQTG
eukprot:XP_011675677.1 PREDICTED: uncharacterized protein LOC105443779 [Strongylocentrotus purpuratus]